MAGSGPARLAQMIRSYWISQIIGTVARLEIADHLADSPLECGVLAEAIGCEPDATLRLLRASVNVGLPEAVRRGERQTIPAIGDELFDYYAAHPYEGDAFSGAMADHSNTIASQLAQAFDSSDHSHVVDIGGATGAIIAALLEANPRLRGTIFERAEVVPRAEAALAERGLSSRCEVMAGDFFKSVPAADLYVLKSILHDWDDLQSVAILSNCVRAMRPNGRLIIIERVVSEQGDPGEAAPSDLNMLILLPGRERSVRQYAELLGRAGMKLDRTIGLGALMLVIEALPAT